MADKWKYTWTTYAEVEHVKQLGMGVHSPGSDLRHSRQWWLKKYLESTQDITGDHIKAGRRQAQAMLSMLFNS